MLYYSSTVGATVKTQILIISIIEKENNKNQSRVYYNSNCAVCGNLQHSTDITGKIKNVLALFAALPNSLCMLNRGVMYFAEYRQQAELGPQRW